MKNLLLAMVFCLVVVSGAWAYPDWAPPLEGPDYTMKIIQSPAFDAQGVLTQPGVALIKSTYGPCTKGIFTVLEAVGSGTWTILPGSGSITGNPAGYMLFFKTPVPLGPVE